jgi:transcriptional regulator with XRE-family HTH domain
MSSFGKRLRDSREEKGLSQQQLAKMLKTSHSVIGRYERDEMTPSVEVARKMAQYLDTTVGYLLGEVKQSDTFKDPVMLKRLQQINALPEEDKKCILYAIDNLLASATTRLAYSK